jgi:hypothetical protein
MYPMHSPDRCRWEVITFDVMGVYKLVVYYCACGNKIEEREYYKR